MSLIGLAAFAACHATARVQKVDVSISADPTCPDADADSADSAEPEDSGRVPDCSVACSDCGDNLLAWGGVCTEDFIHEDGDEVVYTTPLDRGAISDLIWLQYKGDADHGDYVKTEPFDIVFVRTYDQDLSYGVHAAYKGDIELYDLDSHGDPSVLHNAGVSASIDGDELTFSYLDGSVPIAEHHTVHPFEERRLRVQDIPCCSVGARPADAAATALAALLIVALRRRPTQ